MYEYSCLGELVPIPNEYEYVYGGRELFLGFVLIEYVYGYGYGALVHCL